MASNKQLCFVRGVKNHSGHAPPGLGEAAGRVRRAHPAAAGDWHLCRRNEGERTWCLGRAGQVVRVRWSTHHRRAAPEWWALVRPARLTHGQSSDETIECSLPLGHSSCSPAMAPTSLTNRDTDARLVAVARVPAIRGRGVWPFRVTTTPSIRCRFPTNGLRPVYSIQSCISVRSLIRSLSSVRPPPFAARREVVGLCCRP